MEVTSSIVGDLCIRLNTCNVHTAYIMIDLCGPRQMRCRPTA